MLFSDFQAVSYVCEMPPYDLVLQIFLWDPPWPQVLPITRQPKDGIESSLQLRYPRVYFVGCYRYTMRYPPRVKCLVLAILPEYVPGYSRSIYPGNPRVCTRVLPEYLPGYSHSMYPGSPRVFARILPGYTPGHSYVSTLVRRGTRQSVGRVLR